MLGYHDDVRVRRITELLLNTERPDGGYLCDMHEGKYKTRAVKSCIRGSVKVLLAFSQLPEYWKRDRITRLVEYFISRHGIYSRSNPAVFVNKDMERNTFPITWKANVFEILLALSKMGRGTDPRLKEAWAVLDARQNPEGRFLLDWTPRQCPWKVGRPHDPNKWVTLYAYLAKKFRGE
jgi:hypothetical protein